MSSSVKIRRSFLVESLRCASIAALSILGMTQVALATPAFGDVKVLAQVPLPGFPEGIVTNGAHTYVTGPATFNTANNGTPSKIWEYRTSTGQLLNTIDVIGEDLSQEHANSCAAIDRDGDLYVLNTQLGVLRFSPLQGTWGDPLPDLPACANVPAGTACSPVPADLPPMPNDLAFDRAGNLYVTDSLQATIWKYSKLGGQPSIWFQDPRLAPGPTKGDIGVNGIRVSPDGAEVFVSVSIDFQGKGHIYRLPRVATPAPVDLQVFHTFAPGDIPDGIAFGTSGVLWVADATPYSSGIIGLRSSGGEVFRFTNPVGTPINPYDSPANISFNGRGSMLVTNHAFATGADMPGQFQVLEVYVNDYEATLWKPLIP
jgi:sugar lactone lactonase YvrE